MQLDGKIIAPTSSKPWGSGLLQWLEFTKLKGITIKGKGVIDGQGSVWWDDSVRKSIARNFMSSQTIEAIGFFQVISSMKLPLLNSNILLSMHSNLA